MFNIFKNFLNKNKEFLKNNKELLTNLAKNAGIALSFGVAVLIVSILVSRTLYHEKKLVKRGYEVKIKVAGAEEKKVEKVDIATLMKTADVAAGAKIFKKCASCHSENQGGGNKVGPNLYGVVGKKVGSVAGFSYSPAVASKGGNWTIENLDHWLTKPKDFIPGTKMGFAGLKKDKDRANVIAYLKSQK